MITYIKLKLKLFLLVATVYIVAGLLGGLILGCLLPAEYFGLFPAISVFYLMMGLILTFILDHFRKTNPEKLLNIFMLLKMIKFVCTLFFLIIYVSINPDVKVSFSITLMCNYFIYSMLGIYIYFLYNKKIMQTENKKGNATEE